MPASGKKSNDSTGGGVRKENPPDSFSAGGIIGISKSAMLASKCKKMRCTSSYR